MIAPVSSTQGQGLSRKARKATAQLLTGGAKGQERYLGNAVQPISEPFCRCIHSTVHHVLLLAKLLHDDIRL